MVSAMVLFTIGKPSMEVSDVVRLKDLQEENARLKRIVANLTLEIDAVKTMLTKKYGGLTINERR
jgi:putative transposase